MSLEISAALAAVSLEGAHSLYSCEVQSAGAEGAPQAMQVTLLRLLPILSLLMLLVEWRARWTASHMPKIDIHLSSPVPALLRDTCTFSLAR